MSVLNIPKFIKHIKDRPAIWNSKFQCSKAFKDATWDELSEIYKLPAFALKVKWKGLRDNFRVEYKRVPRDSKGELLSPLEQHDTSWQHFHSLLFLVDHMRRHTSRGLSGQSIQFESTIFMDKDEESNAGDESNPDRDMEDRLKQQLNNFVGKVSTTTEKVQKTDVMSNGIEISESSTECTVPAKKIKICETPITAPKGIVAKRQYNDDYHFLMSLQPYMEEMKAPQKLRIRTQIQNIILKELYGDDL